MVVFRATFNEPYGCFLYSTGLPECADGDIIFILIAEPTTIDAPLDGPAVPQVEIQGKNNNENEKGYRYYNFLVQLFVHRGISSVIHEYIIN